jgi:hypothetical protein
MAAIGGLVLHEFIAINREEIIRRCRAKVAARSIVPLIDAETDHGVPVFLGQLAEALRLGLTSNPEIGRSAQQHGHDLLLQGFSVSQVVHDYGDVCQAITELAVEANAPIGADDFRTLNRCLDEAIAGAVTEYGRERYQSTLDGETARGSERMGFLAHELRNLMNTAIVAYEVLKTGNVGVVGSTGTVLYRSLVAARELIGRSLVEVRLTQVQNRERFLVAAFIDDLVPAAALAANARDIRLEVTPVEAGTAIEADRPVLAAVVMNLLQNAFKFTRPQTTVTLRVGASPERVRRAAGRKRQRPVPPVRTERRRSHRSGSGTRLLPMGYRGQPWPDLRAYGARHGMRLHRRPAANSGSRARRHLTVAAPAVGAAVEDASCYGGREPPSAH